MSARRPFEFDPAEASPDWSRAGRVHDWRNHVSETVRGIWPTLTPEQRTVLAFDAQERASAEEWE